MHNLNIKNTYLQPTVSVITPGWNGVNFVHRLLDSILNQTYTKLEYIYVDDGSTDGTIDVVQSYKQKFEDKGIVFKLIMKENGGVCSALNEGLKYVTGDFLCWPEYDDFLTPDSIEKRLNYLVNHPDIPVVTSEAWVVYEDNITECKEYLSKKNPNRFDRNHFTQLLKADSIFTSACHMVRMDKFDETHPGRRIFESRKEPNWQMLLPLYYKYDRGYIDEPLVYYLIRKQSISNQKHSTEQFDNANKEFKRIIFGTLDMINMPDEDRMLYKHIVNVRYAKENLDYGFVFRIKDMFMRGYSELTDLHEDVEPYKWKKIYFENRLFHNLYDVYSSIKHIIDRIFNKCFDVFYGVDLFKFS